MARTYKKESYHPYRKEGNVARKLSRRSFRARSRQALKEGRYDLMPIRKGTEGWLTH